MNRCSPWLIIACLLTLGSCNCSRNSKPGPTAAKSVKSVQQVAAPEERSAHNRRSPIGTNLAGIADWSTELPFVDLFKSSRPWISGTQGGAWDDGRTVAVDESGWVTELAAGQVARTLMLWDVEHYPAGKYVVLYEGEGTITYASSAANILVEEASSPGRHVLDVDPSRGSQGIHLIIEKTNPKNPIRNIRVLLPGGRCSSDKTKWCDSADACDGGECLSFEKTYETDPFNPTFLKRLRAYSVVRFMDWGATNNSEISRWDERPKLDDARWAEDGTPLEIMIDLAHRLKVDAWFNVPHRADDEYVRNMAMRVKEMLKPGHRAWVEFSNEVWNQQFDQHGEVRGCPASSDADNGYHAALVCYADRAKRVLSIWSEVFADEPKRIVRVLASQSANPWASEQILEHRDAAKQADALAIAPYFGVVPNPKIAETVEKLSMEALLKKTATEDIPEVLKKVREHRDLATKHGLILVAYEGGQHFVGVSGAENNEVLNKLFDAANRSPTMAKLYDQYLAGWQSAGGRLFVHYTSCDPQTKWGRFGALEYIEQPRKNAPKFDAIHRFIESHPRWW